MPVLKHIFAAVFAVTLLTSCEKTIDVDLNESSPALVVEADISDRPGPYYVRLAQSVNFDDPNTFPPVSGALVTIADNAGNSEALKEVSPGLYETSVLEGVHRRIYTLTVVTGGEEYTATSTMPEPVTLEALSVEEGGFIGEEEMEVVAWFQDTPNKKNYYRFRGWNGELSFNEAYAFEDKAYDGQYVRYALEPDEDNEDLKIASGDHIEVELQCVDPSVYLYFLTLAQYTGEGPPTAPANPISNISNGALGYFSAHTVSKRTIVVE